MVRDDLWGLGNTTIRNPERIPGAIKVFQKFYHNKKSFAKSKKKGSSQKRQQEFEKKLGRYTEEGNPIKRKNQIAIADYNTKKESKRPGKNGRMWLSIMDDYGMTNSYNEKSKYEDPTNPGKAYITETGKVFSKYKELRNEIFFRQVLKYQVPHYKKQLDNIAIRGGWWFFKLILECDGLTDFEMGIVSLYRTENLVEATKEIRDYRKAYKKVKKDNEKVTDLQDTWKGKLIGSWFKDEYGERVTNLKRLVAGVQNGTINPESIEAELTSKQNKILALGKGADTDRAKQYGGQIKELLENSCFNIDDHITILKKFFGLVKGGTIFSDYVDANSRILLMTGYLNWIQFKDQSPSRLKILDYYYEIVKDAVDNLPCVVTIEKKNNKQKEEYYKYLVNVNKPRLKIDDEEYVEKKIDEMTNELRSLHGSKPKFKKNNIINHSRFKYNQLFVELEKAREENFIRKQNQTKIKKEIKEMIDKPKGINPITLESVIWKAIAHLGGFSQNIDETRNFGLDSNHEQIFTAGGGVPDMQFSYPTFDEIVEVTKMGAGNKGQLTGEFIRTKQKKKPVPEHVANHTFYNSKKTNCVFVAPSIHSLSWHECWSYSCNNTPIIVKKKKINFHIVPLTLEQFLGIFQICINSKHPSKKWIKILSELHQIKNKRKKNAEVTPSQVTQNAINEWIIAIQKYINNLKS